MKINLVIIILIIAVIACNSHAEEDQLLLQPPYSSLTDSIRQQPKNADLYYIRGILLYQNSQKSYAEKDLKKAWQLQPTEEYALSIVTILIDKNRDSAILFIEQALKVIPQSVSLNISLARGYQQKAELQKALAVCDQVLSYYPNSLDALILKAEILKQQGKDIEGLAVLEKAYSYAPFDRDLCYNLAFEYAEAENQKVLALTDSLIRVDTIESHAEPYYFKAVYYDNTGNVAQALNFYDQAIQHDYNYLDAYIDKGRLLYREKKYQPALETFQLTTRITPTFASGYYWTAKCQEAMNNKEEAKLNYQRAYGLDKTLMEAKEAADKL